MFVEFIATKIMFDAFLLDEIILKMVRSSIVSHPPQFAF